MAMKYLKCLKNRKCLYLDQKEKIWTSVLKQSEMENGFMKLIQ